MAEGVHRAEEALEPAHLYGVVDLHPVLLAPVPHVEDNGGGETRVARDDIRAARTVPEVDDAAPLPRIDHYAGRRILRGSAMRNDKHHCILDRNTF